MDYVDVFVEIPKGSRNKYELIDGKLKLDRVLPESMYYPTDYGFIVNTMAQDNDPLDIFVIISNPTFSGCTIKARPIGVLRMEDEKGVDDKILSVAISDPNYEDINDISHLPKIVLKEIKHFLEQYKALEPNKYVKVGEWENKEKAIEIIEKATLKK